MTSLMSLVLDFRPAKSIVTTTREYLDSLYGGLLSDRDETYRLTLTVHELLENVIKYAEAGPRHLRVGMRSENGNTHVQVETRNSASPEGIATLQRLFLDFAASRDAVTIYDQLLATSFQREGSGLGLARIRAEADMRLACEIEGNDVTIRAEAPFYSIKVLSW
ncbi:MAG: hypothetical protein WBY94_22505 [Polyangiaceae bacterium]